MKQHVLVTRKSTESSMEIGLDFNGLSADYRKKIATPIPFLNHMIEHIAWRSEVGITTFVTLPDFYLSHVVCEDLGMTLGKAFAAYLAENAGEGIMGFGDARGMIDEAKAAATISFESRALFLLSSETEIPTNVEGMLSEDLVTFLDAFAQGAMCTLQIDVLRGTNAHHIWEAVFRALGSALKAAMTVSESRKGMTSGVAGGISYDVKVTE